MTAIERIQAVEEKVKKAEQAKIVAETQHKQAEEQLAEITKQMADLGVTPETIEAKIAELETKLEADLNTVENMVPEV